MIILYVIFGAVKNVIVSTLSVINLMSLTTLITLFEFQPFKLGNKSQYLSYNGNIYNCIWFVLITLLEETGGKAHWVIRTSVDCVLHFTITARGISLCCLQIL